MTVPGQHENHVLFEKEQGEMHPSWVPSVPVWGSQTHHGKHREIQLGRLLLYPELVRCGRLTCRFTHRFSVVKTQKLMASRELRVIFFLLHPKADTLA